jgi:hypothetical protein
MATYPNSYTFLLTGLLVLLAGAATAQTPAPAIQTQFVLPLADKTTATAILLPAADDQVWLVYATRTGQISLWTMSPTSPEPSPTPPTPTPPTPPPTPTKLTIAIVEDPEKTTAEQRHVLTDDAWRNVATQKHDMRGIIPIDIKEANTGKPPPALVPFLEATKGKPLPWVLLYNQTGSILWEGPLPSSGEALANLINKHGGK